MIFQKFDRVMQIRMNRKFFCLTIHNPIRSASQTNFSIVHTACFFLMFSNPGKPKNCCVFMFLLTFRVFKFSKVNSLSFSWAATCCFEKVLWCSWQNLICNGLCQFLVRYGFLHFFKKKLNLDEWKRISNTNRLLPIFYKKRKEKRKSRRE